MDPYIEVVFPDSADEILRDRFEMPLFFIVGGADDVYLSSLLGRDIQEIVREKSVDPIPKERPYGVYASRSLLLTEGRARTFPLSMFYHEEWPILLDLTRTEISVREPTQVEVVWIIRALRRSGLSEMAEKLRTDLLRKIYPKKASVPSEFTVDTAGELYLSLSKEQRKYPLVIIIDDLPIQLNKTLGQTLADLTLTQCTDAELRALQTSLELLSLE